MNRKGQIGASKAIKYAIAIILVGVTGALFSLAIANNEAVGSTPNPTIVSVISQHRLFYSPDCFAYEDPITHRVYPGIVDKNKFTEERLHSCYQTENVHLPCFSITIEADSETLGPIYSQNYAGCAIRNIMIERPRYVQLQDGENRIQATLKLKFPQP